MSQSWKIPAEITHVGQTVRNLPHRFKRSGSVTGGRVLRCALAEG